MDQRTILVTGATGATGKETVRLLLQRGQAVRALVRTMDSRADALRQAGAEIMLGDLRDFDSVRAAAREGVRRLLLAAPDEIALDHQNGVFAGTNDLVETIGGQPPMTLQEFVEKHRADLTAA